MGDAGRMLPGVKDVADDVVDADAMFNLGEDEGAGAPHLAGVAGHDVEVGAYGWGEVGLIDDEQVALGEAGAAFAGDFVAASHVDHLDRVIGEFAAEAGSEVVASRFEEKHLGLVKTLKVLERLEVGGNVLADRCVRAPPGFDSADAVSGKGLVLDQEFAVFAGEDVIRYGRHAESVPESEAELKHEGGLAGADGSADTDGESPLGEVPVEGQFAVVEVPCMIKVFMRVHVRVRMRMGVGGVVARAMGMRMGMRMSVGMTRFGHG